NVAQVLPPAVAITSPAAADSRVNQARLEVKAVARSVGDHPVTAMRLLVDGRPYQGLRGVRAIDNPPPGEVQASWSVDLLPGKHVLAVQAESAVSKALSPPAAVTLEGVSEAELPNLYLLAVGISDYPGDMALKCAAADARAITKVFTEKSTGVFRKVEARLLTDREATRQGILGGLAWLQSVMTPKDVAVIFFGGRGARDPRGNFYLVPVDVDEEDPAATCVSGDFVKRALANIPGRLVAMLDACHSGAATEVRRRERAGADDLVRDL